jgi:translation initiation factor 1
MTDEKKPFNNPFAALRDKLGSLPAGPAPAKRAEPKGPARAVVRMERKGRAGKEVTAVEQLGLPAPELERWLKDLKAALGCGGAVEGDALVLQGDHRKRLAELLAERGVRKITVG